MNHPEPKQTKPNQQPSWLLVGLLLVILAGGSFFLLTREKKDVAQPDGKTTATSTASSSDGTKGDEESEFDWQTALTVSQYWRVEGEDQDIKLIGQVSGIEESYNTFFHLGLDQNVIMVWYDNMKTPNGHTPAGVAVDHLQDGDYAVVWADRSPDGYSLWAKAIIKISQAEYEAFLKSKMPALEIEILDYPQQIAHGCQNVALEVRLKNIGAVPIEHAEILNTDGLYKFFFRLNDQLRSGYSMTDDGQVGDWGIQDFGTLEPGQETTVAYGASGRVTESIDRSYGDDHRVGISGEFNIFAPNANQGGIEGTNEFSLVLGLVRDDYGPATYSDPIVVGASEQIEVKILDKECDMDDITATFYVGE